MQCNDLDQEINECLQCGKQCKIKFCSISCSNRYRILSQATKNKMSNSRKGKYKSKDNPNWKGGRRSTNWGYVLIYSPDHPSKSLDGYVMEHRLVMEKHIGRYLKKNEYIHHINEIRNDNRIENLKIVSKSEHSLIHQKDKIPYNRGRPAHPNTKKALDWTGKFHTEETKKLMSIKRKEYLERKRMYANN